MLKNRLLRVFSVVTLSSAVLLSGMSAGFRVHAEAAGSDVKWSDLSALSSALKQSLPSEGYISPKLDTSTPNLVRVVVQLNGQPAAVGRYAAKSGNWGLAAESTVDAVRVGQDAFLSAAESKGIGLKVNYRFDTVLNGMEITVPGNQIPELAKIPGVMSVYENRTYYSIPDESSMSLDLGNIDLAPLEQMGVPYVWAKGLTGKGLKVGVIDTGVDYDHPDLQGAYQGGYDSFFNDDDPYEEPPVPEEGFEGTSHGTHVSGTIVGRAANTNTDIVQRGVAYEAELHVYKVLGHVEGYNNASGTTAQVIDGIERAVKDGMNVINLSLGSDGEKDPNSPDAIAINNAVLAGVVAVVANGNAGPFYYSMGTPASSQLAISVGAVTSPSNHYLATVTSSVYDVTSSVYGQTSTVLSMAWRTAHEDFANILGTAPVDAVYVGLGDEGDYDGKDVNGKVVLVSRGILPFVYKIQYAKEHGAKAVVIFNGDGTTNGEPILDESISGRDDYIGVFLGDTFDFIPTFDMKGREGRAIARALLANPTASFQLTFGSDYPRMVDPGDTMAYFSSRGPDSDGNFSIKPDVSAPGVNILSTWPAYGKFDPNASYAYAYNRISGTSMATPHVAGAALLLKQEHPDWTPFDIRAALANTAVEMNDEEGTPYDVYSQGAGRISVSDAVYTPAVLETVDQITILNKELAPTPITNYNDNASFGLLAPGAAKSEELQLKNTSDEAVTYQASVVMHNSVTLDPINPVPTPDVSKLSVQLLGLESGEMVTAGANDISHFQLKVTAAADAPEGVYEGEVLLTHPNFPSLHLPFVVHVGTQAPSNGYDLQDAILGNTVITPNFDSVTDSTYVSVRLNAADAGILLLNVYGLDDKYIGTLDMKYNLDGDGKLLPLPPGTQTFEDVNSVYALFPALSGMESYGLMPLADSSGNVMLNYLKNGVYKLEIQAYFIDETGNILWNPDYGYISSSIIKPFGVSDNAPSIDRVIQASESYVTGGANGTVIGEPVLTYPTTEGVTYQVIASSNPDIVGNDGLLKSLPTEDVGVFLTVAITAADNHDVQTTFMVLVTIPAAVDTGGDTGNTGGDTGNTGGGTGNTGGNGGGIIVVTPPAETPSVPDNAPSINSVVGQGQSKVIVNPAVTTEGGITKATVTDGDLEKAMKDNSGALAFVVGVAANGSEPVQLTLTAAQTSLLAQAKEGSTIIVSTGASTLALPVSLLQSLPEGADVHLTISGAVDQAAVMTRSFPDAVVAGTPVSFEVSYTKDGKESPIQAGSHDYIKRSFIVNGKLDAAATGALYIENGKTLAVPAVFTVNDDGTTTVTISRPGLSVYAAATRSISFRDISTSWAKTQIQTLANKFLLNGTGDHTFAPKQSVTRAEFASMLVRALGLQASSPAPFEDVLASNWFAADVAAAYEAGLVTGVSESKFDPNAPISRQDMTVLLTRAAAMLKIEPVSNPTHHTFADSSKFASYASESIQKATETGLISGIEAGGSLYFQPEGQTTREAAAMVLYRLLQSAKLIN